MASGHILDAPRAGPAGRSIPACHGAADLFRRGVLSPRDFTFGIPGPDFVRTGFPKRRSLAARFRFRFRGSAPLFRTFLVLATT